MSILDKVVAAVTPPESEEARLKAHAKARASAGKAHEALSGRVRTLHGR
jgi:hypothetical protein